jgi:MurNAc alpha-1-phosphate uridylyltransferase
LPRISTAAARIVREGPAARDRRQREERPAAAGEGPWFILNGDGLWSDGRCRCCRAWKALWIRPRMDALLLLHPLESAIGREAKDRGDYFLDAAGRARHRGAAGQRAPIPVRQRVDL